MTFAVTRERERGRLARVAALLRPWLPRAVLVEDSADAPLATWLKPQRYAFGGAAVILVVFGGLVIWNATSNLERGALAQGVVQPESYRKTLSSPYGAVLERIDVRENQHVEAGDALLLLDPTISRANTRMLERKHWAEQARIARLTAIQENRDTVVFPKDLLAFAAQDAEIADVVATALTSFANSRASLTQRLEQFRSQQHQANESLAGHLAKRQQLVFQLSLIQKELDGVEFL
ncbi:MAG: HlyD family type secretion periplasmic adaptor subunit, partial [Rhodospirillales bacterium]|nr:HlyD family type secretion periplasmic adaptor subunit [Rhodospirillales bacterium]